MGVYLIRRPVEAGLHRASCLLTLVVLRDSVLVDHALRGELVADCRGERWSLESGKVYENDWRLDAEAAGGLVELLRRDSFVPLGAEPHRDRIRLRRKRGVGVQRELAGFLGTTLLDRSGYRPSDLSEQQRITICAYLTVRHLSVVPAECLVPLAARLGLEPVFFAVLLEHTLVSESFERDGHLLPKLVAIVGKVLDEEIDEMVCRRAHANVAVAGCREQADEVDEAEDAAAQGVLLPLLVDERLRLAEAGPRR